jgi:hypothetical protein
LNPLHAGSHLNLQQQADTRVAAGISRRRPDAPISVSIEEIAYEQA